MDRVGNCLSSRLSVSYDGKPVSGWSNTQHSELVSPKKLTALVLPSRSPQISKAVIVCSAGANARGASIVSCPEPAIDNTSDDRNRRGADHWI
ncbi:hypothetical protein B0H19DRAFT_1122666 [Mycena capillaripes]|nr:hypothetical protein B0H19DRAFT_1122666 [Mycena capillaripes]